MKKILPLFLAFLFFSCGKDNPEDSPLLGKWEGISWVVDGQESGRDASQVTFEFLPTGSYSASFGEQGEQGSFYTQENKLYTTAQGQVQKVVQVMLLGEDTLQMDMNRVGTPEVLTLVRQ